MRNFQQIPINNTVWSYKDEVAEKTPPIREGEKIRAFKDPVTGSVCIKFVIDKNA